MATEFLQNWESNTGAFDGADLYMCRIIVPYVHKLVTAAFFSFNIVTTGTVTASLRGVSPNGPRGGALVGTEFNNTTLDAHAAETASMLAKRPVVLAASDKTVQPADCVYFMLLSASDSADRLDEPGLLLEVEKVS